MHPQPLVSVVMTVLEPDRRYFPEAVAERVSPGLRESGIGHR